MTFDTFFNGLSGKQSIRRARARFVVRARNDHLVERLSGAFSTQTGAAAKHLIT